MNEFLCHFADSVEADPTRLFEQHFAYAFRAMRGTQTIVESMTFDEVMETYEDEISGSPRWLEHLADVGVITSARIRLMEDLNKSYATARDLAKRNRMPVFVFETHLGIQYTLDEKVAQHARVFYEMAPDGSSYRIKENGKPEDDEEIVPEDAPVTTTAGIAGLNDGHPPKGYKPKKKEPDEMPILTHDMMSKK